MREFYPVRKLKKKQVARHTIDARYTFKAKTNISIIIEC